MKHLWIKLFAFISALVNVIVNLEAEEATGVKAPYRIHKVYLALENKCGERGIESIKHGRKKLNTADLFPFKFQIASFIGTSSFTMPGNHTLF